MINNKNVIPKPGQVWEDKCGMVDVESHIDNHIGFTRIGHNSFHRVATERFLDRFKFVPQNDLEWFAVNLEEWNCVLSNRFILKNGVESFRYLSHSEPMHPDAIGYKEFKQCRNELYGIELKEGDTIQICPSEFPPGPNPQLWDVVPAGDKINKGEQLMGNVDLKLKKHEEKPVNTDKLIPIDFSRNITPAVEGDVIYDSISKETGLILTDAGADLVNLIRPSNHLFVESFADRPNTGTQPVGSDVVVDVIYEDDRSVESKASSCGWLTEGTEDHYSTVSWKPNLKEMLKQYQAEQAKIIPHDKMLDILGKGIANVKPEFTQAMKDDGILPPEGSECIFLWAKNPMSVTGTPVRVVITYLSTEHVIHKGITEEYQHEYCMKPHLALRHYQPIDTRTDEEKLVYALMDEFNCDQFMAEQIAFSGRFKIKLKG